MRLADLFTGSFHSAATYREVRRNAGFYMGYTFLIVAYTTLLIVVYGTALLHREVFATRGNAPSLFEDTIQQIITQVPVMSFSKGQLQSQTPAPTVIRISGQVFGMRYTNFPLGMIDTSGNTTMQTMSTPILVTATEIYVKGDNDTRVIPLKDEEEGPDTLVINRTLLEDVAAKAIEATHDSLFTLYLIMGGMMWAFAIVGIYIARMCMVLLLGLAGLVIGAALRSPLTYAQSASLAAVSYTPVAFLDTCILILFRDMTSTYLLFAAGIVALTAAIACSKPAAT